MQFHSIPYNTHSFTPFNSHGLSTTNDTRQRNVTHPNHRNRSKSEREEKREKISRHRSVMSWITKEFLPCSSFWKEIVVFENGTTAIHHHPPSQRRRQQRRPHDSDKIDNTIKHTTQPTHTLSSTPPPLSHSIKPCHLVTVLQEDKTDGPGWVC